MTAYGNLSPGSIVGRSHRHTCPQIDPPALKSTRPKIDRLPQNQPACPKIDRLLREQNRVLELLRHWKAQALMEQRHALLPHIAPIFHQSSQAFGTASELSRILVKLAQSTPQLRFLIDAFDECSPSEVTIKHRHRRMPN
jgi:hypothetical protein